MGFLQQNDRQCNASLMQPHMNSFPTTFQFQLHVLVCNTHVAFHLSLDPSSTWKCLQKGGGGEHKAAICFVPELGEGSTQPTERTRFWGLTRLYFPKCNVWHYHNINWHWSKIKADYKVSKTYQNNMEWNMHHALNAVFIQELQDRSRTI